ncbi:unnamed protein product [Prunus armeniaca]
MEFVCQAASLLRKGEEGNIGVGGLIKNSNGDWAEISVVLFGSRLASHNPIFFPLTVEPNSKLVVTLVNDSSCDPLHPLFSLIFCCKSLMSGGTCHIQHSYRESNSIVDLLAFIGITEPSGLHIWDTPSAAVRDLMFNALCRVSTPRYIV